MCEYRVIPYSYDMDHPYEKGVWSDLFPEITVGSDVDLNGIAAGDVKVGDVLEIIPNDGYPSHRWRKVGDQDGMTKFKAIDGVIRQHRRMGEDGPYPDFIRPYLKAIGADL